MSDLSPLIAEVVESTVLSVFDTMAGATGQAVGRSTEISDIAVDGVGGSVGFAGAVSGVVYLLTTEPFLRKVTGGMLGSDTVQADEMKDVMGELTNMVAGGVKNRLAQLGFDSSLTIPTFIRAEKSRIHAKNITISTSNDVRFPTLDGSLQVRVLACRMP